MLKYLKNIKSNITVIGLIFIIFFLLSFFSISEIYNKNFSYYRIQIQSDFNPSGYFNEQLFRKTMDDIAEYNLTSETKITYADINYSNMLNDIKIDTNGDIYDIYIKTKYFTTTVRKTNGVVNNGSDRCIKYIETILGFNKLELNYTLENKIVEVGRVEPYSLSTIIASSVTCLFVGFIVFYTAKNKNFKVVDIANDDTIFKHPFNKKYWKYAKNCFNKVKNLTNISILFSLLLIGKLIQLPSGFGDLGISFTYIVFSIIAMLYGPLCGILIGALSDILGHFLFNSGTVFFFGYTISAIIAGFVYGLCFYKTKFTFSKCLVARIIVNFIVNVILGTIWWSMFYNLSYDATMTYFFTIALPKNIIYLLPQSIVLYIVIKALANPLKQFNLLDEDIADNISII